MVCPNCKSKEIVAIQDQRFCITCGQMVPEAVVKQAAIKMPAPRAVLAPIKVQSNGLPEGVKIIDGSTAKLAALDPEPAAVPAPTSANKPSLIRARQRLSVGQDAPPVKPRKRKPGRPKAGKLDVPKKSQPVAVSVPDAPVVTQAVPAAKTEPTAAPAAKATAIAITKPTPPPVEPTLRPNPVKASMSDITHPARPKAKVAPAHHVHRVGVAPLHFGNLIAFSMRERFRHHHLALGALSAVVLAALAFVGVNLLAAGKLPAVADAIMAQSPRLIAEVVLLGVLYYIGRSIGQAAIVYGVAREADGRPVSLATQLGIAINTFGRRLRLDLIFGAAQVSVLAAIALLVLTGGTSWGINPQIQLAGLFAAFLLMLYISTALSVSRGLSAVALVLTKQRPTEAAKLGWQLFSHRLELLGLRLVALVAELLLALPLSAAAVGIIMVAPPNLQWLASLLVGALAWFVGAVMGAGTSTWWVALYRKIIQLDHPAAAATLLSGRQPAEANRLGLTCLVAVSTSLIMASIVVPWLQF